MASRQRLIQLVLRLAKKLRKEALLAPAFVRPFARIFVTPGFGIVTVNYTVLIGLLDIY